jgi:hypothetical protein
MKLATYHLPSNAAPRIDPGTVGHFWARFGDELLLCMIPSGEGSWKARDGVPSATGTPDTHERHIPQCKTNLFSARAPDVPVIIDRGRFRWWTLIPTGRAR